MGIQDYAKGALMNGHGASPDGDIPASWRAIDLTAALAGDAKRIESSEIPRSDGINLFYTGKLHELIGEPESLKTWFALHAVDWYLSQGLTAVYIDFEGDMFSIVARLKALGTHTRADIARQLIYVRPFDPQPKSNDYFDQLLDGYDRPSFACIDGVTEATALEGFSINDNTEMAIWRAQLIGEFIRRRITTGVIDHQSIKTEKAARGAMGATAKLTGVDVELMFKVIRDFGVGLDGLVSIRCGKDRDGTLRGAQAKGKRIVDMHLHSDADTGDVSITLEPPDLDGAIRQKEDRLEQAVLDYVNTHAGSDGLPVTHLKENVTGKNEDVYATVLTLAAEGRLTNAGTANRVRYVATPGSDDELF